MKTSVLLQLGGARLTTKSAVPFRVGGAGRPTGCAQSAAGPRAKVPATRAAFTKPCPAGLGGGPLTWKGAACAPFPLRADPVQAGRAWRWARALPCGS